MVVVGSNKEGEMLCPWIYIGVASFKEIMTSAKISKFECI